MTDDPAMIAARMRGIPNRTTYAPDRIATLMQFPPFGSYVRASPFARSGAFRVLKRDGLVVGNISWAAITPLGTDVQTILKDQP